MKNILLMVGVGGALCSVTACALLGAQGRFNFEGTRNIPLLHALFTPPGRPVVSAPQTLRPVSTSKPPASIVSAPPVDTKSRSEPPAATGGLPAVRGFAPGEWVDLHALEKSGMTVDDVNDLVEQVRTAKTELSEERAALRKLCGDIELRERDVAARQAHAAGLLQQVLDERAKLERAIKRFNERVVVLPIDEEAAFVGIARTIAKLRPEAAAELLVEFWQAAGGQVKVAKILAVMREDRADAVLACLDTKRMREVLEKRMTVVRAGKNAGTSR